MKKIIVTILLTLIFGLPALVLAQAVPAPATVPADDGATPIISGLNESAGEAKLIGTDKDKSAEVLVKEKIGTYINIAISFMGILFFVLLLYAGYLYMTSGGDAGILKKAKGYIIYTIVGVIIITLSYAATYYVVNELGKNF